MLEETIHSLDEIADGKWDHVPEQAVICVGSIEQVQQQAKNMERGREHG